MDSEKGDETETEPLAQAAGNAVLIAGPTGSGKSALALALAARLSNPLIVNADSMQVYRDLSIVTARPNAADLRRAEHALYGHRDGGMPYSVADWREEVRALLMAARDRPVLFVGGTGLYFRVLLEGLSPIPPVPDAIRNAVRTRLAAEGPTALHDALDPAMAAQLSPTDSQRIARALEVLEATGRSLADWQAMPADGGLIDGALAVRVVLDPPKEWLEARLAARAGQMMQEESLAEIRALMARRLSNDLPVMRALGVSELAAYVGGEVGAAGALTGLVLKTRRYAKRQRTWFRGQMAGWQRLDPCSREAAEGWLRDVAERFNHE